MSELRVFMDFCAVYSMDGTIIERNKKKCVNLKDKIKEHQYNNP